MIIFDPVNKYMYQFINADLLGTVMNEARMTLWFACFLALVNTGMSLVRSRDLVAAKSAANNHTDQPRPARPSQRSPQP